MTWIELRKPLPIPYKPIHVAWSDGDTFEFQPRNAKRMCLPADYANLMLGFWNQLRSRTHGNHWIGNYSWYKFISGHDYGIGKLINNTGKSIQYHFASDYSALSPAPGKPVPYGARFGNTHNWSHDKTNHRYSFEFYLDNDLEETTDFSGYTEGADGSPLLYDEDETFWKTYGEGTGTVGIAISEELTTVKKGSSSLKLDVDATTGTYDNVGVEHVYAVSQNWSDKDFFCFYFYGINTGETLCVAIFDSLGNWWRYDFVENWSGWKRLVFPIRNPSVETATPPDLTDIKKIQLKAFNLTGIRYLDRVVVDVGQWVKVETFIPDVLLPKVNSFPYADLYSWDPGALVYRKCLSWWDPKGPDIKGLFWSFLNGDVLSGAEPGSIYGGPDNRAAFAYVPKFRGGTATRSESTNTDGIIRGDVTAGDLTYSSYYGCRKRIGFAVKMPPDDGQDSSTYGISQCKLKLEVYYDKETYAGVDRYGAATYEFEDSTNPYYGLQNINEAWIALFPESGASKGAEMLFLSARPTGLEVSADEDGVIYKVKLTLPKGTAVYAGSLLHGDVTLDSDGDGVPDCLEMLSYQLTGQ